MTMNHWALRLLRQCTCRVFNGSNIIAGNEGLKLETADLYLTWWKRQKIANANNWRINLIFNAIQWFMLFANFFYITIYVKHNDLLFMIESIFKINIMSFSFNRFPKSYCLMFINWKKKHLFDHKPNIIIYCLILWTRHSLFIQQPRIQSTVYTNLNGINDH